MGDRLLLQLLKDESIVQRGRKQVSQRIENQNILRRERILTAAFDVQYTQQRFSVCNWDTEHRARVRENSCQIAG